jgi:hypothetical protein
MSDSRGAGQGGLPRWVAVERRVRPRGGYTEGRWPTPNLAHEAGADSGAVALKHGAFLPPERAGATRTGRWRPVRQPTRIAGREALRAEFQRALPKRNDPAVSTRPAVPFCQCGDGADGARTGGAWHRPEHKPWCAAGLK